MTLQKLLSLTRKIVDDRQMIQSGDRVAVGLSGGKDSLALLTILKALQRYHPSNFSLAAFTVDLGFKGSDFSPLIEYCQSLGVEYHIIPSQIAEIVFDIRKEKNPCSLCSKLRRGMLNSFIKEKGFNKLALGHHADDLLETFFLSLYFEGRLSTFAPVSFMSKSEITLIRPLILIWEKNLQEFSKDLPVMFNPCPVNHATKREDMKNLIASITKKIPIAKDRMLVALTNPKRNNLWEALHHHRDAQHSD